jgi:uncharacterized protein (TIGR04255 family)
MSFPKKLNPDNLKDTLVEIGYAQGVPQELLLGVASSILEPLGYHYLPVPNQNINIALANNQRVTFGWEGNSGGFFIKDDVRVQLVAHQIIFNCLEDKYVGWKKYFQIISDTVRSLFDKKAVGNFNRVSIRYISEFKNIAIYQGIKGVIEISETGLKLDNSILRLTDEAGDLKAYVTLTNKAKRISQTSQEQQIVEASLIDVNVYENFNPASDLTILWDKLQQIHIKQKEIFFGLISSDFLNTLNPEY